MEKKKQKFKEFLNEFTGTTDACGIAIDKGILNVVIYLNLLGYTTDQSCDGHKYGFAFLTFKTPTETKEDLLSKSKSSIYWNTHNHARNIANKAVEDKYGELDTWNNEINDYWDDIFIIEIDNHPDVLIYKSVIKKTVSEFPALRKNIHELLIEFSNKLSTKNNDFSLSKTGHIRISFISENLRSQFEFMSITQKKQVNVRSSKNLILFEKFLKNKYYNQ